ncbi:hypothetical protein [Clostridium aminobutyricum]|uniref:Uncharacterized protein n=1 Tax=Clostridium aminobutyricum TaxID=33953 RepID=A0A939DA68_CLOAM|nr:hypothetical protein [Clostridium aminobutyricum]MBN7773553.1 hypothetical protein [Clostridium aminobutyricum]
MNKHGEIYLPGGINYLSQDELTNIQSELNKYDITLIATDDHAPQASFNDICIFISQNTTELIVSGLMMPVAYDVLVKSIKFVIQKIKEKVKILQGGQVREAQPSIHFKTENSELIAPIPQNLTDEQFNKYFESINEAIKTIHHNSEKKYEYFIIEQQNDGLRVEVKTIIQYAQDKIEHQKKDEVSSHDENNR